VYVLCRLLPTQPVQLVKVRTAISYAEQLWSCKAKTVNSDLLVLSCRCTGGPTQPLQQQLLQQQWSGLRELPCAGRWIHTSGAAAGEVVVPAMGDSITEGSVAALLKQPGGLQHRQLPELKHILLHVPSRLHVAFSQMTGMQTRAGQGMLLLNRQTRGGSCTQVVTV
jgi:hypothetical protein